MVKLRLGKVHTNWYSPGAGAMNLISLVDSGASNLVLAITLESPEGTQLLAIPATIPSAAIVFLVFACTITRLRVDPG
jgi:hypothetical protein|tara:strand:- start:637 stop:870 length:234 start_codon:yes stop_codon:yes gene_type:complete